MNLKFILLLMAILMPVVSQAQEDPEQWTAPAEADTLSNPFSHEDAEVIERGQETYVMLCADCHGDRGDGTGAAGQAWDPSPADFTSSEVQDQTDGSLYWKISEGNPPAMLTYKNMIEEEEIWQLVTYLRSLGPEEEE
ncbi:MAG: c-type cytochrome [Bacteroidota bacterium]